MTIDKNNKRYTKGLDEMKRHLGEETEQYVNEIAKFAPLFAKVNVEFAFGDIYGNEDSVLDLKTKELITLGALTVQGSSIPQLRVHVRAALRAGASKEEIVEAITQMLAYCGFPSATNAILAAKDEYEKWTNTNQTTA